TGKISLALGAIAYHHYFVEVADFFLKCKVDDVVCRDSGFLRSKANDGELQRLIAVGYGNPVVTGCIGGNPRRTVFEPYSYALQRVSSSIDNAARNDDLLDVRYANRGCHGGQCIGLARDDDVFIDNFITQVLPV